MMMQQIAHILSPACFLFAFFYFEAEIWTTDERRFAFLNFDKMEDDRAAIPGKRTDVCVFTNQEKEGE